MTSLKGHLLIAAPRLRDPNFARTVLLVLVHDEGGAMGLVLNRPTGTMISDLAGKVFEEGFVWDRPIHLGGPVKGPFTVIHALEDLADREVIPGVYQTIEATKVQEVISRKPEPLLAVANHSGWGPGQLEGEFDEGSWLSLPATQGKRT
jgi:putative transcriptional regulator